MCDERESAVLSNTALCSEADGRALLYQTRHDMEGNDALSVSVVDAVTAASGVDPTDVEPPFYEYLDPQSLDGLFLPKHDGTPRVARGHLVFEIYGHTVVVHSDGRIAVYGQEPPDSNDAGRDTPRRETPDVADGSDPGSQTEG